VVTDHTNLVTIDLNRLVIEKNVVVNKTENDFTEISPSPTGDTVIIDDFITDYFLNTVTGKKNPFSKTLNVNSSTFSKPRSYKFFGREGKFAYAITNVSNNDVAKSLYQITLATNITKKIVDFQYSLDLDINQDIFVGYDKTATNFTLKGWQMATGKQLFSIVTPHNNNNAQVLAAKVFDRQKKLVIIKRDYLQVYDIPTGKLISSSRESLFSITDNFTFNHSGTAFVESNSVGGFALVDTSLHNKFAVSAHEDRISESYFSANDSLIYTISWDNTIKVFKSADGKLLGTLYLFKDSKDYVFVHPTGRFDGTPEGIKKLYYVQNKKIITLDKVYEKFYTPGLYQRLVNGEEFDPINIIIKGTPKVKIIYAEATRNLEVEDDIPTYPNKTGFADIVVNATTEDDNIDEIRLFHNGKIVTLTTRNLIVAFLL
jgi:WD40 repeat protein